jgi:hypothetical protein
MIPLPKIRRCNPISLQSIKVWRAAQIPMPCTDQSAEQKESYYRSTSIGEIAIVRDTRGRWLRYTIETIAWRSLKMVGIFRVGSFYMESCSQYHCTGGGRTLVRPTDVLLDWIKENPDGVDSTNYRL